MVAAEPNGPASPVQAIVFQTNGVRDGLPVFYQRLAERMTFRLSWLSGDFSDFAAWRATARSRVREQLLAAPPSAPFEPKVIAEQDRGSYVARKVVFNLTGDSRVLALMLVPKSAGPHPAVLLLHDHGAKFDIGSGRLPDVANRRSLGSHRRRGVGLLQDDAFNWLDGQFGLGK